LFRLVVEFVNRGLESFSLVLECLPLGFEFLGVGFRSLGLVLEFLVDLGLQSLSLGFKSISHDSKNSVIFVNSSVLSRSC